MIAVSWVLGAKFIISEAWPKALIPNSSATCNAAGESVCWVIISAPWLINTLAASASFAGSYQVLTQTTSMSKSGFTEVAPK